MTATSPQRGVALSLLATGCTGLLGLDRPSLDGADAATRDAAHDGADATGVIPRDCLDALQLGLAVQDGPLEIDPDGTGPDAPFTTYCEMTTDGGGWTLVYAYTFTNYEQFTSSTNAVTPRPSWPYTSSDPSTPISSFPPSMPTTPGAVAFARWPQLGSQFLITSTISNSLSCRPGGGDLVAAVDGSVSCTVVTGATTSCPTEVPTSLQWQGRGPALRGSSHYYFWEASTTGNWPVHDPCGSNQPNHLTAVPDPRGAIYLRR